MRSRAVSRTRSDRVPKASAASSISHAASTLRPYEVTVRPNRRPRGRHDRSKASVPQRCVGWMIAPTRRVMSFSSAAACTDAPDARARSAKAAMRWRCVSSVFRSPLGSGAGLQSRVKVSRNPSDPSAARS
jgi:hypothetical protein